MTRNRKAKQEARKIQRELGVDYSIARRTVANHREVEKDEEEVPGPEAVQVRPGGV